MQSYTRRRLKQDRFVEATSQTVHWTVEHRKPLIVVAVVAAVIAAAALGFWFYISQQNIKASQEFGKAMSTYNAPVGQAQPGSTEKTYASSEERSKAARQQFEQVEKDYPRTHTAKLAAYMVGVTAADMGDNKAAEQKFKEAADTSDADLSSMAKLALGNLYRSLKQDDDAIRLYNEVMKADAAAAPKINAQVQLATLYADRGKTADAMKIYQEIEKSSPQDSAAAQIAKQRLEELQKNPAPAK